MEPQGSDTAEPLMEWLARCEREGGEADAWRKGRPWPAADEPPHNALRVRSWDGIRMTGSYYRPPFPPLRYFLEQRGQDRVEKLYSAIRALRHYWIEYGDDELAPWNQTMIDAGTHPLLQEIRDLAID